MKLKKVLILTTNYGDGHIKTANSLSRRINDVAPEIDVKIVNLYKEAHPLINKAIRYAYFKCYSYAPKVYDFLYYLTRHPSRNLNYNNIQGMFGRRKLKEYLKSYNPDLIINTYSILAVPMLRKKGYTKVPCYTIVTDYGAHSQWIDPGVHKYYVGHESIKDEMVDWGVNEDKIEVSGIPVYIDCSQDVDHGEVLKKYGIKNDNMPLVTLLGGANSIMRNMSEVCEKLYKMKPEVKLLVVCGRNKALKEKLDKDMSNYTDRIKIVGFLESLHEVIKVSDVVITKPGGITVTEILNLGTPFIMYGSPAGQEKDNKIFLLKNNCSHHASNSDELIDILSGLLKKPKEMAALKENLKHIRKPEGCSYAIDAIITDFENGAESGEITPEDLINNVSLNFGDAK